MWYYKNKPFETTPEEFHGFVYEITELSSGMKYIGKKFFWTIKTRPPLKGKKRKRKERVETDWKNYFGSNVELKENVSQNGSDNYKREIIRLCKNKGECSYYEAKEQFDRNVLFDDTYYNKFIGCKIHANHL